MTPRARLGVAAGIATLIGLGLFDAVAERELQINGVYLLAPAITAMIGGLGATALVASLALAFGVGSGWWSDGLDDPGFGYRIAFLAAGCAFAVAVARSRERTTRSVEGIALLDSVGAIADGSLPLATTLDRITRLAVPAWADACMIDAIRDGASVRVAVRVEGHPRAEEFGEWLRSRRPSTPDLMLKSDAQSQVSPWFVPKMTVEVLRSLSHDEEDFARLVTIRPRSAMIVPLRARGRIIGTLTLLSAWSHRRYSDDDLRLAQALAGRVALALDNAGLYTDLSSFERRMDNVMEILDDAVVMHDSGGEMIYANPAAARAFGYESTAQLLAATPNELLSRISIELEAAEAGDHGASGPALLRVTDRSTGDPRWWMTRSRPIEGPEGEHLYTVTTIDDMTEVKLAETSQRLLGRTGELLASSIDHEALLEAAAGVPVPELADWAAIGVPTPSGAIEQVAITHHDSERLALARRMARDYPPRFDQQDRLSTAVLRTGESRMLEITDEVLERVAVDEEHMRMLRAIGTGWMMIVPMRSRGRIVGVMTLANDRGSRRFADADLELACELANRIGDALENARLASEQASIASVIQRELRPPPLPEIPGWQLGSMYRPAGEVNEAGGDFYDAFETAEGWMVVLGDVAGRGAAAASLTALARYTARTAASLSGDPRVALRKVHEALASRRGPTLITMAIVLLPALEEDEATVEAYLAGQPLPLLVRDGVVTEVGSGGPLLGAHADPEWSAERIGLRAGDQLVVYTDGVTDARDGRGGFFGVGRLRETLSGCESPGTAVERVERALGGFAGEVPEDDAALLAIQRTGLALASARGADSVSTSG